MRKLALLVLILAAGAAFASDHADPAVLATKEAGITDLFFFPHGTDYIVMLCVRPALNVDQGPFKLDPYTYKINFDFHTPVSFDNAADKARYGGTVGNPSGIKADASIIYQLNNDATLKGKTFAGFPNSDSIRIYTGVRDDPFIFPRFFGKNTIAAVFAIPQSSFPAGRQDFIIYGEAWEHGDELVDTVGRSNRSQNARYQFLVDVPANKQVEAIKKEYDEGVELFNFLNRETRTQGLAQAYHSLLQLYPYDLTNPDVMIFTTRFPVGYPNGRLLTDDVAYISCQYGDCALMSLSYAESPQFPRATVNDKPFSPDFPFLADPWPPSPGPNMKGIGLIGWLIIIGVILLIILILLISRLKWKTQYPNLTKDQR
ncbi:MAG TPA: hypothetical protein VEU30_04490 [Thermoanaerobaculia bacterium]|nr:hypothetical protein [Thermoanaerobaculia bacterium]